MVLACGGCRVPEVGLAPSFLPNLGLAGSLAVPLREASEWRLEARFTDQFLDDKAFADDGNPAAGNWTQLDLGLQRLWAWEDGRAWSVRLGLVGFEARGEPNLADEAGDYFGAYLGVGRFARLGRGLAFGPELTLVAATGPDPRVVIPQLTWGLRWSPRGRRAPRRASRGAGRGNRRPREAPQGNTRVSRPSPRTRSAKPSSHSRGRRASSAASGWCERRAIP
jgi:hypothetical protein